MNNRPIVSMLNRLLIGLLLLVTVSGFFLVPLDTSLPIHWGLDGRPDGFAPAPIALLMPSGIVILVIGLLYILKPAGLRQDFEAGRYLIDAAMSFVIALAIALGVATIAIGLGLDVDMPRLIAFIIAAQLLVLGNYLPKTQPNWIAGIKLPWTLRDPDNWRVTHRWTGRLMMLGGLVALLAAILNLPPMALIIAILAAVLLPVLAGIVISYMLARR